MAVKLRVAFYKPQNDGLEPFINRLTEFISGKFVHCELVFPSNESCSIYQGEQVFIKKKTFGRDSWIFKSVSVSERQHVLIRAFCNKQKRLQVGFNKSGLIRCTTPFPRSTDQSCWFCSELIISALQAGGMCKNIDSSMTTPTALFEYLQSKDSTLHGSAVLNERADKKGMQFKGVNYKKKSRKAKPKKKLGLRFTLK